MRRYYNFQTFLLYFFPLLLFRNLFFLQPNINFDFHSMVLILCRSGFHHRLHGKPAGGAVKGMVGRLSIAVVVLLICTVSLLARMSGNGGSRSAYRSDVSSKLTFSISLYIYIYLFIFTCLHFFFFRWNLVCSDFLAKRVRNWK